MDCAAREVAVTASDHRRNVSSLLREAGDLERLRNQLTALLSILGGRGASIQFGNTLLGLWIDSQEHSRPPHMHESLPQPARAKGLRIVEAIGIKGIWMLFLPDSRPGAQSRTEALAALLETWGQDGPRTSTGQFAPIFDSAAKPALVWQEMQHLERRYAGLILEPLRPDLTPWQARTDIQAHPVVEFDNTPLAQRAHGALSQSLARG